MTVRPQNGNGNGNGRGGTMSSQSWTIIAVALTIIGQTWWLASKIGTLEAEGAAAERRLTTLEQIGSPSVQGIKTEGVLSSSRIAALEAQIGTRLTETQINAAVVGSQMRDNIEEIKRLRDFRVAEATETAVIYSRLASLDAATRQASEDRLRMAALEARITALAIGGGPFGAESQLLGRVGALEARIAAAVALQQIAPKSADAVQLPKP